MDHESRRRLFWSCYLINSFSSDVNGPREPSEMALKLALPCCDQDYDMGHPEGEESLSSHGSNGSISGELIRVMTLW